jgi:hypothetical protein
MTAEAQEKKDKKEKRVSVPSEALDQAPVEPPKKASVHSHAPADPRVRVLKKFQGKLLPKGVLRDRFKVLMARWNSADGDHGGVTVAELQFVLDDWKRARGHA